MFQPARYKFFRRGVSHTCLQGVRSTFTKTTKVLAEGRCFRHVRLKKRISQTDRDGETIKGRILVFAMNISPLAAIQDPAWSQMAKRIKRRLAVSIP